MIWRRPGDRVLTLEQRLVRLERTNSMLVVSNLVLVGVHLQALGSVGNLLSRLAAIPLHLV